MQKSLKISNFIFGHKRVIWLCEAQRLCGPWAEREDTLPPACLLCPDVALFGDRGKMGWSRSCAVPRASQEVLSTLLEVGPLLEWVLNESL